MSPKSQPLGESTQIGNLFTLFLCDPLAAFCFIMNLVNISDETYSELLIKQEELYNTLLQLIQSPGVVKYIFFLIPAFSKSILVIYLFIL